jgi:hypothetical protein
MVEHLIFGLWANLTDSRQFYLIFPENEIGYALRSELRKCKTIGMMEADGGGGG